MNNLKYRSDFFYHCWKRGLLKMIVSIVCLIFDVAFEDANKTVFKNSYISLPSAEFQNQRSLQFLNLTLKYWNVDLSQYFNI